MIMSVKTFSVCKAPHSSGIAAWQYSAVVESSNEDSIRLDVRIESNSEEAATAEFFKLSNSLFENYTSSFLRTTGNLWHLKDMNGKPLLEANTEIQLKLNGIAQNLPEHQMSTCAMNFSVMLGSKVAGELLADFRFDWNITNIEWRPLGEY